MVVDLYMSPVSAHDNDHFIEYGLAKLLALSQLGHSKMTAQQQLPTTPEKTLPSDIVYSRVTEDDTEAILEMLKIYFFKDEPLNTYLQLGECKELEKYAAKSIPEDCSFKATSPSGEIIGVFLNGIMRRPDPDYVPEPAAPSCEHQKFKKVLGLMDLIETRFNVFDLYPDVDAIMDGKILSVDSRYRGKGIANELTRLSLEYMRQHGIPLMHVLCSSHYSAQLMKKLAYESVFVLPLSEYVDENGDQVLKPELPHVQAEVLVKRA